MDDANKFRMRTLRNRIKSIRYERRVLLEEQRECRVELDKYKEVISKGDD